MELMKNTFIDIHYTGGERAQAERLARLYEKRGYSREADDIGCIQLLTTDNVAIHKLAPKKKKEPTGFDEMRLKIGGVRRIEKKHNKC